MNKWDTYTDEEIAAFVKCHNGQSAADWRKELVSRLGTFENKELYCPRRIITPQGYIDPRAYSTSIAYELKYAKDDGWEFDSTEDAISFVGSSTLVQNDVPTFFVKEDLLEALIQSEPPDDILGSDLKWPYEAILFAIPTSFSLKWLGLDTGFISISHIKKGTIDLVHPTSRLRWGHKMEVGQEAIFIQTRPLESAFGEFHSALVAPDTSIRRAIVRFKNYCDREAVEPGFIPEERVVKSDTVILTPEKAAKFVEKVSLLAFGLVMVMNARPEFIERPADQKLIRAASTGKHQKSELWEPLYIGRNFKYERGPSKGGTHASPRMHWRRSHWKLQPYGPRPWTKESPTKLLWIERALVNPGE